MKKLLLVIFLAVLASRLYVAFQYEGFSSDETFYILRQVERIRQTGIPIFEDELSFGGRTRIVLPFYYYLLALFNLFLPLELVAKVLPNVLASSLVIIAYYTALEISKSDSAALFTAFLSGFIPVFYTETVNSASVFSLVIPLTFFLVYCVIKIPENKSYVLAFIGGFLILTLTHSSAFLLILGLLFYLLLMQIEYLNLKKEEIELILFSTVFFLWVTLFFYKDALLFHGPWVIWQNTPMELLSSNYSQLNLIEMIVGIGLLPFLFGLYVIYLNVWKKRKKSLWLLIGFSLSTTLLLWLKLIQLKTGLIFLGSILVFLFGYFFKYITSYMKSTRASRQAPIVGVILFVFFLITSVYPAVSADLISTPSVSERNGLLWIKQNTKPDATVLWSIDKGNMLNYLAERRSVSDSDFLLVRDSDELVNDMHEMYTGTYLTNTVRTLNKHQVDYIILSQDVRVQYNISRLPYYDENCFETVYEEGISIIRSFCIIE